MNEKARINIARAGEFFMYCLWLQGQMADLLIFKTNLQLIELFVANPEKVPPEVTALRAKYWEKDLGPVKKEFEKQFHDQISVEHLTDLNAVCSLRNIIGHCHVSIAREYLLYRPSTVKREQEVVETLGLKPVTDQATPTMMTLRLHEDEQYFHDFNRIKRLDEECFSAIAASIGIPHGRIR